MKKPQTGIIIQPRGEIANKQTPFLESLQEMHPVPRLLLGTLLCAAVAFYAPLILLTVTGAFSSYAIEATWLNLIIVLVLALINLGANKIGRVMLCAFLLAAAFDLYWTTLVVRMFPMHDWLRHGWANYFYNTVASLLNGYLFVQYKKVADL